MKSASFHSIATIATLLTLAVASGCHTSADTQHEHDHQHDESLPGSLQEAVEQLQAMNDEIRKAFSAGTPEECHDSLHEIGHVIEAIPEAAAETDLTESDWNEVKGASERLMDAFGEVDSTLHTGKPDATVYGNLEEEIESAIQILTDKAAVATKLDEGS